MRSSVRVAAFFSVSAVVCSLAVLRAADDDRVDHSDRITELSAKLERGQATLDFLPGVKGYLSSLLKQLGINIDSQVLVFSKTSFQVAHITPQTPRALYFNDNVAVGWVPDGDVMEILTLNSIDGMRFYSLHNQPSEKPKFDRPGTCLSCHLSGMMVQAVYPDKDGNPFPVGKLLNRTDHRTPFNERWGGWYVTGTHGSQTHNGNAIVPDPFHPGDFETEGTQNITDLSKKVDLSRYLSKSSDIVALMTLEHQTQMANYLVRLANIGNGDPRLSPQDAEKRDSKLMEEVVTYMLFAEEIPLADPIRGNTTFAKTFPERGPRDSKGRSLRDFDLQKRMFKYPLSYMIYSEAFEALPTITRNQLYRELFDVLTGKNRSPMFARLSVEDRQAIIEIVRETKKDLPEFWTK
jgi:hypothetical protein